MLTTNSIYLKKEKETVLLEKNETQTNTFSSNSIAKCIYKIFQRSLLNFQLFLNLLLLCQHILLLLFHKNKKLIWEDIERYTNEHHIKERYKVNGIWAFVYLMKNFKPFRNQFYYRIQPFNKLLLPLYPEDYTLKISLPKDKIKGSLLFHHPIATILNAKSIGENCTIRHSTTLGNKHKSNRLRPTLLNNVDLGPNVVIIGDVTIGNNVVVGAGSVITKSVPDNCVVIGNPAYLLYKDGVRVNRKL